MAVRYIALSSHKKGLRANFPQYLWRLGPPCGIDNLFEGVVC
jgi:hypothetical protein